MKAQKVHGSGPSKKEEEYLQGWQRARAELLNYRQRVQAETQQATKKAQRKFLEPLLQLADNFQAIATHVPEELKTNSWAQGVVHVTRQLDQLLAEYQLEPVGIVGEKFDPQIHEAVDQVIEEGKESGTVAAVITRGYRIQDSIIRPARVTVFS